HFLHPGCGIGGSCYPKDPQALIRTAEEQDVPPLLLRAVSEVNNQQQPVLFRRLQEIFEGDLRGKDIAVRGLASQSNNEYMREAPSRYLMEALWAAGAVVQAYDPEAMTECRRLYGYRPDLQLCATRDDCLQNADALVICTEWKTFRVVDFDLLRDKLRSRLIL